MLYYEELVDDFNNALEHTLRSHRSSVDFLSLWVPNQNHRESVMSMVDAAKQEGVESFSFHISFTTISKDRVKYICESLERFGTVFFSFDEKGTIILISALQEKKDCHTIIKDSPNFEKVIKVKENKAIKVSELLQKEILIFAHNNQYCYERSENKNHDIKIDIGEVSLYFFMNLDAVTVKNLLYSCPNNILMRGILEALCSISHNLPLEEIAEHGVLKTVHLLLQNTEKRLISGIILPHNCGEEFLILRDLLNKIPFICDLNQFDCAPSEDWLAQDPISRLKCLKAECVNFCFTNDMIEDSVRVLDITNDLSEWPIRVFIEFSENVPPASKPNFIRKLEKQVKKNIEKTLQIYHAELKDKSKIRRL